MAEIAPEFNESDLARLVLDYLEEEECPMAYNAFIKSSHHLDGRMAYQTSSFKTLKDIYAEYCTFRTYTRSGKVPTLHSQLLKCKTILNTAQLFFSYIKMLQALLEQAQQSVSAAGQTEPVRRRECGSCGTASAGVAEGGGEGCGCRARPPPTPNVLAATFKSDAASAAPLPLECLVETTQLADLPGTSAMSKRKTSPDKEPVQVQRAKVSDADPRLSRGEGSGLAAAPLVLERDRSEVQAKGPPSTGAQSLNLSVKTSDLMNCSDDLNDILGMVNRTSGAPTNMSLTPAADGSVGHISHDPMRRTSSMERSFHDFVSGVSSAVENKSVNSEAMPDSSTPESVNTQTLPPCNYEQSSGTNNATQMRIINQNSIPNVVNVSILPNVKLTAHSIIPDKPSGTVNSTSIDCRVPHQATSSSPNKIKILSNSVLSGDEGKLIIAKATGSTNTLKPLPCRPPGIQNFTTLSPKVIQINGLAAYQQLKSHKATYSKDQIMAMPIYVMHPTSTSQTSSASTTVPTTASTNTMMSSGIPADSGYKSLEPVAVDLAPAGQLTALENVRNFINSREMPKETVSMEKVSTPNKPLLIKKASSTPRRTSSSHVRVLDFNTPRRILAEEINQEELSERLPCSVAPSISEEHVIPVHTVIDPIEMKDLEITKQDTSKKSKAGWDADLRALLPTPDPPIANKPRKKRTTKDKEKCTTTPKKSRSRSKESKGKKSNNKSLKAKKIQGETPQEVVELPSMPSTIKPTINIKQCREVLKEAKAKDENCVEITIPDKKTPDSDIRLHLDHPTTAKTNLSDFFPGIQTPLKSMLDNIQMETPRFDPSVFGDPISDIKIGDIPTPNFLNTPNFALSGAKGLGLGPGATPSSYSSRPTDYSSGGSYYRPDEQDYVPPPDDFQPPPLPPPTSMDSLTRPESPIKITTKKSPQKKRSSESENSSLKSGRPRRQCTLKVSYYDSPTVKNSKPLESKSSTEDLSENTLCTSAASPLFECFEQGESSGAVKTRDRESMVKDIPIESENIAKYKFIKDAREAIIVELEMKRKRTIAGLKKRTPVKSTKKRRSSSSFPKLMIRENKSKSAKKPKTVAELKKSITPRRMPNESIEKSRTKLMSKDPPASSPSDTTIPAPMRSRRKSSTPRKVDKFVAHNIDDSVSADAPIQKQDAEIAEEELPPLRVSSDDGSQDCRALKTVNYEDADTDEIHQIRAFIEKSSNTSEPTVKELVQRGFDLETAKSIERDLLGTPRRDLNDSDEHVDVSTEPSNVIMAVRTEVHSNFTVTIDQPCSAPSLIKPTVENDTTDPPSDPSIASRVESNESTSKGETSLKNDSAVILEGDIILSNENFNEESANYFTCKFDANAYSKQCGQTKIDENFSLCIQFNEGDDAQIIRVCLAKQDILFDIPPKDLSDNSHLAKKVESSDSSSSSSSSDSDEPTELEVIETLHAVQSISNIDPLYTPIKADCNTSMQRQCIEIFDSTLNSLDTPLKQDTPLQSSEAYTPCADVELVATSSKIVESAKRKRQSDSPIDDSMSKKSRPDRRLLQDIDIDFVLTKIHGESEKP